MVFIRFIVLLLVLVGALNWGLWGFFQYDLVQDIFGSNTSYWARIFYGIIGIAGLWGVTFLFNPCFYHSICSKKPKE